LAGYRRGIGEQNAVTSYRDLRRGIGILGLILPVALVLGKLGLERSVSAYYYTDMRNWFVGTMWATGFFLIFYRYGKPDTVLSSIAGVLAILVSLFPTTPEELNPPAHEVVIGAFHLVFAAGFLLLLAYFCLFLFTRSDVSPPDMTRHKKLRNKIYRGCGIAITAGIVIAALLEWLTSNAFRDAWHPVFWCEAVAVIAFGIAWLIKGETLFADPPEETAARTDLSQPDGPQPA
jgi:hypothetical protein